MIATSPTTSTSPLMGAAGKPGRGLPHEIYVQILTHNAPGPLDLLHLGAGTRTPTNSLARAARDASLWRSTAPPGALAQSSQTPLDVQFIARMNGKTPRLRQAILDIWRQVATVASSLDVDTPWSGSLFEEPWGQYIYGAWDDFDYFRALAEIPCEGPWPRGPSTQGWGNDATLMHQHVARCGARFYYASEARRDEVSLLRLSLSTPTCDGCSQYGLWSALEFGLPALGPTLRAQPELLWEILARRPHSFRHCTLTERSDAKLLMHTLRSFVASEPDCASWWARHPFNPLALAADALRDDEAVAREAMTLHPMFYLALSHRLQLRPDIGEAFVDTVAFDDFKARYLPASLRDNDQVMLRTIDRFGPQQFRAVSFRLKASRAFKCAALQVAGDVLGELSAEDRDDAHYIRLAIGQNPLAYRFAAMARRSEPAIFLQAAYGVDYARILAPDSAGARVGQDLLYWLAPPLRQDITMQAKCIEVNPGNLVHLTAAENAMHAAHYLPHLVRRFGEVLLVREMQAGSWQHYILDRQTGQICSSLPPRLTSPSAPSAA